MTQNFLMAKQASLGWFVASLMIAWNILATGAIAQESTVQAGLHDRIERVKMISQTVSNEIPLVIAHRGASGYLPEHTLESAAFAHALGADYIEQDVVLTKDGVAVVLHDITLNSISNVAEVFPDRSVENKFYVFDFTLAELRELRIHERESSNRFPSGKGGFRIATLAEQIQLIQGLNQSRKRNAGIYVEIKRPSLHRSHQLDSTKEVLSVLSRFGYADADDRVFIQCFEASELLRLRTELNCRLPLIQLFGSMPTNQQMKSSAKVVDGIGIPLSAVVSGIENDNPVLTSVVADAHELALMVHVWTLRDDRLPKFADSANHMIDWLVKDGGVDGIFTDHPDTLVIWRTRINRQGKLNGPFHLLRNGDR